MVFSDLVNGRFKQPTIKLPKSEEKGYFAGLLDGEGAIMRSRGTNRGHWRIQIAMTDEGVIEWLGSFGGVVKERKVTENRRRCWVWLLMTQLDVALLLEDLLPLLRVKRDRASEAIIDIRTREASRFQELLALEGLRPVNPQTSGKA